MTTFDIKMPKLGESITEGTIIAWSVKVGDVVNEDDILFEVSTAKVSAEIPSPVAGKVKEILFKEGDTIAVGIVVMLIEIEGEGAAEVVSAPAQTAASTAPAQTTTAAPAPVTNVANREENWYSPVVLQLANEAKIAINELNGVQGTGYLGRLTKKDVQQYILQKKTGAPAPVAKPVPASPAVVSEVAKPKPVDDTKPQATPVTVGQDDQVVPMDFVRRIIADRMVESKKVSPHVTTFIEVDVTKLVAWRKKNKDAFAKQEGVNLTYMPSIVEAVTRALIQYPQVNASVDGYNIILKKHINVGIAVSLDDGNLVVPVIHDADKLNIRGLAQKLETLATSARTKRLKMEDIQGGTFTITNFGSFKSIMGTPIINQPEAAILGVGFIEKKPAVLETPDGDVIAIRHKMYLSLSYDHRIIDGSLGGKFLLSIAQYLEQSPD